MLTKLFLKIWPFVLLALIVVISQIIILKPHLKYGFSDVDWGFLSIYKMQNPYSISQFIENFKVGGTRGGVYTHQIYYIGIQDHFFNLNFESFQITTHIFKILAILAAIPIFLSISGSILVTFLATVLFAFSYSSVGTMYTVVTSSDYSAIFSLGIFISLYWYIVKKKSGVWLLLISALFLMILTLFLSTERMYPLPMFIVLTEVFLLIQRKKIEKNSIKRILVLLLPPFVVFLVMPSVFLSFFLNHGVEIVQRIQMGNWNLLLTPPIVLGSIILPHDYAKYIGVARVDSFLAFINFLISGPFFIFIISTVIIGIGFFKKSIKFIFHTSLLMLIFSVVLYITASHFKDHVISREAVLQALVGFYILAIALSSFKYWMKDKNRLLLGLFISPFLAFLYIFLTWLGASTVEVFSGIHRYLTIPALLMSLFLGNILSLLMLRLLRLPAKFSYLKGLVIIPIIMFVIFLNINATEIQTFFMGQLRDGFGAEDKTLMRNQLLSHLDNISSEKRSLIYFDFSQDNDNGYYYDNTLLGGFGSWTLWHKNINFNENITPITFWNNLTLLKSSYLEKNGRGGFLYNNSFFEIKDFYAFRLKNKRVIDIKSEIINNLGI